MTRALTGNLMGERGVPLAPGVSLTVVERAQLRLLVAGRPLAEAAPALGLSSADAERLLAALQARCGVPNFNRLLVRAVLNVWV